jgi:hypothetical protein
MVPDETRAMISLSFGWDIDGLKIVMGTRMAIKHFVSIMKSSHFPSLYTRLGRNCQEKRRS